ncbi:urease accessory protein UreD [Gemmobacter lanyuensis]|uniref:Urease accessory protein UreD n=2 Tax=Gemmobacter lanyuensis TaxID=1054497 RepID=A0A918MIX5_9RHOB|nr:urease accessory protein UreD [Gemmobacter lanyuensis]
MKPAHWANARVGCIGVSLWFGVTIVLAVPGCSLIPKGDKAMRDAQIDQQHERSHGEARVAVAMGAAGPRLSELWQSGSAKAFLPKGAPQEVIFLNTSGGLTGGDRLALSLEVGAGLHFTGTTQTAERAYAAVSGCAEVQVNLTVGAHAHLDWLPQETLIYQASALKRETTVALAPSATCLLCETLILGRHAMRETVTRAQLQDRRLVLRAGRPVWAEALALTETSLAARQNPALLAGAQCCATVALIAPGAEDAAQALRPLLAAEGCETSLSAWDGRAILRLRAAEGWPLRRQLARILGQLRGRPLPRVWQMNGDLA